MAFNWGENIMATLDSILNWLVPTILILVVVGFVYTKFISPWVVPHLIRLWEWAKGSSQQESQGIKNKEIVYE